MKKDFRTLRNRISMLSIGKKLKLVNFMMLFVPTFFAVIAIALIYVFFISDGGDYVSMLFKSKENVNIAYDSCEFVYDSYKKQLDEAGDENIYDVYFETPAGTAYATVYKDGKLIYEVEKENRPKNYNELIKPLEVLKNDGKLDDIDKIRGLGLGADDYIEKPFSPGVLVAKVKSNLAQYKRLKKSGEKKDRMIICGDITVNPLTHRVFVKGNEVELKNKEYELLVFFMNNIDIVFSKEQLYESIWGFDALGDNSTVAVHVNRLREKIEEDPSSPKHIRTVWGAGYRFMI